MLPSTKLRFHRAKDLRAGRGQVIFLGTVRSYFVQLEAIFPVLPNYLVMPIAERRLATASFRFTDRQQIVARSASHPGEERNTEDFVPGSNAAEIKQRRHDVDATNLRLDAFPLIEPGTAHYQRNTQNLAIQTRGMLHQPVLHEGFAMICSDNKNSVVEEFEPL